MSVAPYKLTTYMLVWWLQNTENPMPSESSHVSSNY